MSVFNIPFIPRLLDLPALVARKSHFLFGPRQTGKTFLLRKSMPRVRTYDLLDNATFLALSRQPERLDQEMTRDRGIAVIDEIQRLPSLLNEVHRLIESRGARFLLTGSSARKLRRGGVNLLGGRARISRLHPLTCGELGRRFQLERALHRGLLPSIYFSDDPEADLDAYCGAYLLQEVTAEGAVRDTPAFSRLLGAVALCSGTIVNFTNLANDAQVPRTTVYEYFELLKDSLLLHEIPAWRESRKRKPIRSSKYYLFDGGVARRLQGRSLAPGTPEFGAAFEAFLCHELVSRRDYHRADPVSHWRSTSGFEVDFILGDHTAVEVKAKRTIHPGDLKPLRALSEERRLKRFLCVCLEPRPRNVDGVRVLPYRDFLSSLWAGEYD